MTSITIEASRVIPASADTIYAVIADYHVGHQAILPKPAFREMKVLDGGYGAGTRLHIHVRMWGQSVYFDQIVEEPKPGRVLVEREINTGQQTTFTLEPLAENNTQVTITSIMPLSSGFKGFLERISQPKLIGDLFKVELDNLANYVVQQEVSRHNVTV